MKTAEILAIGTEITSGQKLDTNSKWLGERMTEIGVETRYHTAVADDLDVLAEAFRVAMGRANIVLSTGGLGPTLDDLTQQALALALAEECVVDEEQLGNIRRMFADRGRPITPANEGQALRPPSMECLTNEKGTAPGLWLARDDLRVAAFPGVPFEMKEMFNRLVLPRLREFAADSVIAKRVLHSYGLGESSVEERLGDLTRRGRNPEVGITASEATISLRILATASTEAEANRMLDADEGEIRDRLGDLVFGQGDDTLQSVVVDALKARGATVALAESCTGGLTTHLLAQIPGASHVLLGGVVAYANEVKMKQLGVPVETLERHGAVSPETAEAMARGVRERFGADYGLSTTGVAGPDGGSPEKPVGLVHVALAGPDGVRHAVYNWASQRTSVQLRSSKTVLNLLRLEIERSTAAADG